MSENSQKLRHIVQPMAHNPDIQFMILESQEKQQIFMSVDGTKEFLTLFFK